MGILGISVPKFKKMSGPIWIRIHIYVTNFKIGLKEKLFFYKKYYFFNCKKIMEQNKICVSSQFIVNLPVWIRIGNTGLDLSPKFSNIFPLINPMKP